MATQELAQKVCQKYGWSARFEEQRTVTDTTTAVVWVCYVTVGLHDERKFAAAAAATTTDHHHHSSGTTNESTEEETKKEGIAAASQAALDGLQEEIARNEAKPQKELTQVFPLYSSSNGNNKPLFVIRGSSPRNWDQYIWSDNKNNGKQKPSVVGIDTEGNQNSPPVLVQIATDDVVILEITSMLGNRLSDNLQRLLADNEIVKVFCDNYGHQDKRSLGLLPPTAVRDKKDKSNKNSSKNKRRGTTNGNHDLPDFSQGPIVDLEVLSSHVLGPVKVARGLSRIVTLSMPELNVLVGKPSRSSGGRFKSIGRFALIEQGKAPPITSLRELSRKEQHYAAVDAWATLQAYKRLAASSSSSST